MRFHRKEWTSHSFRTEEVPTGAIHQSAIEPRIPFKIHWLIMMTRGVRIWIASVGQDEFLFNTATDLYHVAEWDRLVKLDQLDRVRIDAREAYQANPIMIRLVNEGPPAVIEGAFVGEQIVEEKWYVPANPLAGIQQEAPTEPAPVQPRPCRECGASGDAPCFGMKKGETHKGRSP